MKKLIITRICVLIAALGLFSGAVGCLDMSPFPSTASDYTLEYYSDRQELHVTFAPETEIYNLIANIEDFSGNIDECVLWVFDRNNLPSNTFFDNSDCSQLDSAEARNGSPITLVFAMSPDVLDCGNACDAKIDLDVTVSGTMRDPNGIHDIVLDNETATYVGPFFNPGILNNEPEFLDLNDVNVIVDCTEDHELWDAGTSSCVCENGYERDTSTGDCMVISDPNANPNPNPNPNPDPDPDPDPDTASVDTDGDGIPDDEDNCPEDRNPGQFDVDHDGVGNACDTETSNNSASAWGSGMSGGACQLDAGAGANGQLGMLAMLLALSVVAVRRRFK